MTRHPVFVVAAVLVGTIDIDGEFDGPFVTVEFRHEVVLDRSTPAPAEFVFDRVTPADDRCDVGDIVCAEQREALAVVEFAVEVDGLDPEVKAFEHAEELGEDAAGGVAVL